MKTKKTSRILSGFLVIIMLLSLISTSIYADVNMYPTPSNPSKGSWGAGFCVQGPPDGYRISVYYAEIDNEETAKNINADGLIVPVFKWPGLDDKYKKDIDYFKVGKSADIRRNKLGGGMDFWGVGDVFEYINFGESLAIQFDGTYNWYQLDNGWASTQELEAARTSLLDDYSELGKQLANMGYNNSDDLDSFLNGISKLTSDTCAMPEFITGPGKNILDTKGVKGFFSHPYVLKQISAMTGGGWQPADFVNGYYNRNGENVIGQYKIYIEVLYYGVTNSNYGCMTLREMIAAHNRGSNLDPFKYSSSGGNRRFLNTANALRLEKVDYSLKFNGTTIYAGEKAGETFPKSDVGQWYNEAIKQTTPESAIGNSGGVGVITSPSIAAIQGGTKVVRSYVEIENRTFDADGNIIINYKEAEPSDVTSAIVNEDGTTSLWPPDRTKGNVTYILNDVVVSTRDITNGKESGDIPELHWDEVVPKTAQDSVKLTKKEVSSYLFGRVEASPELSELIQNKDYMGTIDEVTKEEESKEKDITPYGLQVLMMQASKSKGYNLESALMAHTIYTGIIPFVGIPAFINQLNTLPNLKVKPVYEEERNQGIATLAAESNPEDDGVTLPTQVITDLRNIPVTDDAIGIEQKPVDTNISINEGAGVDQNSQTNIEDDSKEEEKYTNKNRYSSVSIENSDNEETITVENKKGSSDALNAVKQSTQHVIYVRYIVAKTPKQIDVITTKEDGVPVGEPSIIINDLIQDDVYTDMVDIRDGGNYPDIKLIEWYTNKEFNTNNIPSSDGVKEGTTIGPIESLPSDENVYVFWEIDKDPDDDDWSAANYEVPQWRLSRFWPQVLEGIGRTSMSLNGIRYDSCDCGHMPYLTPNGNWSYDLVNPNKTLVTGDNNNPEKMKVQTWLHSGVLSTGDFDSISLYKPNTRITINGNLNAIKSTDTSSLQVANWLNKDSLSTLIKYDISGSILPNQSKVDDVYIKKGNDTKLEFRTKNINSYTNGWYSCGCWDDDDGHHHSCSLGTQTYGTDLNPGNITYIPYTIKPIITFKRYNQTDTSAKKLVIEPEVKNESGMTSIKYQLNNTLNIYPEYGMLFANDAGGESIKWVVGDQARKISPVVYQTLQHKVYVVPNSNGTSYATDSRAITQANSLGEARKQVIYKGAGVNTAFQLYRDSNKGNKALLTVKTYALDFRNDKTDKYDYTGVKSSWGNTDYNSYKEHESLLKAITEKKTADATEKLLVDSPAFGSLDYTGAIKSLKTGPYNLVKYSMDNKVDGGNAVVFEHRLLVRGGAVIGVVPSNRSTGKSEGTPISMEQLKTQDLSLYNALLNMNLYNESIDRSKTVFSTFEHLTGDALTEGSYVTMLEGARKEADSEFTTPASSAVSEGKGWYSEDTTVLVVKEYVSNYEVPSISFGDKLSMSVKGLETPIDKGQFFKTMGKGHTYLRYDLKLGTKLGAYSLPNEIDSYFEYTSFGNDTVKGNLNKDYFEDKEIVFGEQKVDYLVPNVSVSDTTRLS